MGKFLAIGVSMALAVCATAAVGAAPPLKLLIYGGTGNIGQRIVHEALSRGDSVTVVVRDPSRHALAPQPRLTVVKGDVLDSREDARLLAHVDGAVCAVSFRGAGSRPGDYRKAAVALVTAMRQLGARAPHLVFVGGAGSLEVKPGVLLVDSIPAAFRAEVLGQQDALEYFRTVHDVPWTYFSPAGVIAAGARTGKFRLGGDRLVTDAKGESRISMEDYAVAVLDEMHTPRHIRQRFTIGY